MNQSGDPPLGLGLVAAGLAQGLLVAFRPRGVHPRAVDREDRPAVPCPSRAHSFRDGLSQAAPKVGKQRHAHSLSRLGQPLIGSPAPAASIKYAGKQLETLAKPLGQLPLDREAHDDPAQEYVLVGPAQPGIGGWVYAPVYMLPSVIGHDPFQESEPVSTMGLADTTLLDHSLL